VAWVLPDGTPCQMPSWAAPERAAGRWVLRSKSGREIALMADGAPPTSNNVLPLVENEDLDRLEQALGECMWTAVASPPGPLAAAQGGTARLRKERAPCAAARSAPSSPSSVATCSRSGSSSTRNDGFLMMLAAEPRRAHLFLDKLVERHLTHLEAFLAAVGSFVDIVLFGDDLGMQTGPQISPEMYALSSLKPAPPYAVAACQGARAE